LISTCISKRRFLSSAQRLVHQHDGRMENDRARQGNALLLPAGELARVAVAETAEPHQLERPAHPLVDRVLRPAPRAQRKGNVLEDIEVRKDRVVLKHHAKATFLWRHSGDVRAVEQNGAAVGADKAGDHHQGSGLA
jgi:hypothetical protein